MQITAAVADTVGQDLELRTVDLGPLAPDEVLVEIKAVGICGTDVHLLHGHLPFPFPAVFGHEGAGVVRSVGESVTTLTAGDHVVLSFNSCGTCAYCTSGYPNACVEGMPRNYSGARADGTAVLTAEGHPIGCDFFGQSSFATYAVGHEVNAVKVPDDIPFATLAPFGCGVQTGVGTVLNVLDAQPGQSLLVTGGGSVGLSAVMAAVSRHVATIVVSDPLAPRRELALQLGATHVVDPAAGGLVEQVTRIVPGGVDLAVDTTGVKQVVRDAYDALGHRATLAILGVPADLATTLELPVLSLEAPANRVVGVNEGDANPTQFIPHMVQMYRAGELPVDKMITTMPFAQINDAIARQLNGDAVKIVLSVE